MTFHSCKISTGLNMEKGEDIENVYKQVEVSHGSTSNQTSMYASSSYPQISSIFSSNVKSWCCDLLYILIILIIITIASLFWCDVIPLVGMYVPDDRDLFIVKVK